MNYRSIFVLILLPLTLFSPMSVATAEEITVTVEGNGGGSSNEVHIESNTSTTVEQNNNTSITNNVEAEANTGNNNANHNSGDTNTQTGDTVVETNVQNTNINQNTATTPPCNCNGSGTTIHVSGNGSGSYNTAHTTVGGTNSTYQNNTANITNNVVTNANTGKNSAVANVGDVHIQTGSIYAATKIVNEDVNISTANDHDPMGEDVSIKVSGNGAGSINAVAHENLKNTIYSAQNVANIYNSDIKNLNTGGNKAEFNLGDVWIGTGDIISVTEIINKGINVNDYTKTCDCEKPGEETPPTVTPPTKPPHHNGEGKDKENGGVGGNGEVMGAANGEVLPITGQLAYLFLTLSAIILFLAGWYLRFRSGVAPGVDVIV